MKKILFSLITLGFVTYGSTQTLSEGFDDITTLAADGWTMTNQSEPQGTSNEWFQGTVFEPYSGTSFIAVNYQSTEGEGVISNWLMTPVVTLNDGDEISFFTRVPDDSSWADNLELRISTNGADSADPSGAEGVGDYTILALTVNEIFPDPAGYPQEWTQYSYEVEGLGDATECRVALRYTVPVSAGPSGNNSNYIGVDEFLISSSMATTNISGLSNLSAVYPNPAKDVVNVRLAEGFDAANTNITLTNISGKQVATFESVDQVNVAKLPAGIYIMTITDGKRTETKKLIKK